MAARLGELRTLCDPPWPGPVPLSFFHTLRGIEAGFRRGCGGLCRLAGRALERSPHLQAMFDLGRAVGTCLEQAERDLAVHSGSLLPAVRSIPEGVRSAIPVLRALAAWDSRPRYEDFAEALSRGAVLPFPEEDLPADVSMALYHLHRGLLAGIEKLGGTPIDQGMSGPPAACCQPRWDGEHYQLFLGEELLGKFRGNAHNVIRVLAAFEEEGWPELIDDPLDPSGGGQRLHDTIKWLNRRQLGIRFGADGSGKRILWKRV